MGAAGPPASTIVLGANLMVSIMKNRQAVAGAGAGAGGEGGVGSGGSGEAKLVAAASILKLVVVPLFWFPLTAAAVSLGWLPSEPLVQIVAYLQALMPSASRYT